MPTYVPCPDTVVAPTILITPTSRTPSLCHGILQARLASGGLVNDTAEDAAMQDVLGAETADVLKAREDEIKVGLCCAVLGLGNSIARSVGGQGFSCMQSCGGQPVDRGPHTPQARGLNWAILPLALLTARKSRPWPTSTIDKGKGPLFHARGTSLNVVCARAVLRRDVVWRSVPCCAALLHPPGPVPGPAAVRPARGLAGAQHLGDGRHQKGRAVPAVRGLHKGGGGMGGYGTAATAHGTLGGQGRRGWGCVGLPGDQ